MEEYAHHDVVVSSEYTSSAGLLARFVTLESASRFPAARGYRYYRKPYFDGLFANIGRESAADTGYQPGFRWLGFERTANGGFDLTVVPYWMIALATATLPVWWLARTSVIRVRRMGHARRWRCAACGYDVRATPDRCPECGAVSATGAVAPTRTPGGSGA